ncbi:MAG: manganese-dependent inorganic pyrophosphatase [Clostridia bacterium]|nr:manganese-dependent inorganic pyrophosphatase [Clostridia bacterium]
MENIIVFGHQNPDTDTIMSAIAMANLENKKGNNAISCKLGNINKETKYALEYFKQEEPKTIENVAEGQEVILVDHNEFSQSAKGIENAKILRVVDHHKIGDFKTSEPLYYTAMPVGCTATIIYGMYEQERIEIEPKIAGLMLSAIISDTLLFKSPTCTSLDVEVGNKLAQIANVDVNKYGIEMLKAGTDLSDFSPKELINIDSKTFTKNEVKMQIAQVNTTSIEDVLKNKEAIENAMNEFIKENSEDLFVLLITDILENNSQILVTGSRKDLVEKSFGITLQDNMAFLPGVVSRKKQVVPVIDKNI